MVAPPGRDRPRPHPRPGLFLPLLEGNQFPKVAGASALNSIFTQYPHPPGGLGILTHDRHPRRVALPRAYMRHRAAPVARVFLAMLATVAMLVLAAGAGPASAVTTPKLSASRSQDKFMNDAVNSFNPPSRKDMSIAIADDPELLSAGDAAVGDLLTAASSTRVARGPSDFQVRTAGCPSPAWRGVIGSHPCATLRSRACRT